MVPVVFVSVMMSYYKLYCLLVSAFRTTYRFSAWECKGKKPHGSCRHKDNVESIKYWKLFDVLEKLFIFSTRTLLVGVTIYIAGACLLGCIIIEISMELLPLFKHITGNFIFPGGLWWSNYYKTQHLIKILSFLGFPHNCTSTIHKYFSTNSTTKDCNPTHTSV